MRRCTFLTIAVSCCLWSGCNANGMDSAQRIALGEQAVTATQAAVQAANAQILDLQTKLAAAQAAGANSATLATMQDMIATATAHKADVDVVMLAAQEALAKAKADPSGAAEWDVAVAIVQAVSNVLGPKGAAYGAILTLVMTTLGTVLFKRRAAVTGQALTMVTAAVEQLPDEQRADVKGNVASQMAKRSAQNAAVDAAKAAAKR